MKYQVNCWGITGDLYKQGLYSTKRRAMNARHRFNVEYGGHTRSEIIEVPVETKKPLPTRHKIGNAFCFCAETPLYVSQCPKCGKTPFTD